MRVPQPRPACDDGKVTFRYREAASGRWQRRTLPGADFLWLIVQHVLQRGRPLSGR